MKGGASSRASTTDDFISKDAYTHESLGEKRKFPYPNTCKALTLTVVLAEERGVWTTYHSIQDSKRSASPEPLLNLTIQV